MFFLYSECPNTGRPVWLSGRKYVRFSNRPDFGRPVHTVISGFRTSGSYSYIRKPDVYVRFSDERLKSGGLGTGQDLKTPKSGCPDFGALLYL